ncbi:DUF6261 family protein [Saccharicrinis aurantiacus]|uniref:DUF6261 family protein n=1 Tax=Saccharicrinis aurantiacus TaxID=1849719 RepID=UPI00083971D6|nr:DUF6261 family protein [Saccharicrinis aurantiacus]
MINKLSTQSRVTEVDATSKLILEAFSRVDLSADTYISNLINQLTSKVAELSTAIKRDSVESELDTLDAVRDELIQSVNYLLMGFERNPNPTFRTSATALKKVYDKYGVKIISESYAVQSSLTESLMADMLKPELKGHVDVLAGVSDAFEALATAQNKFNAAELHYKEQSSQEAKLKSASLIKKEVCSIVNNDIVLYLGAMQKANQATYGSLALTIDKIIDTNNTTVKSRSKKKVEA